MAACAMVAAVGTPSFAGSWDKPQVPKGEAPVSKSQYYMYNVAAGQFLVNGSTWKTRATLGDKGFCVELTDSVHTPLASATFNTVALQGWTIRVKDTFKNWSGSNLTNTYVFADSETQAYCDMASQGHNFWKFIPWGENYRIKIADEDDVFGVEVDGGKYANSYLTYMPDVSEGDANGTSAPYLYPLADISSNEDPTTAEWQFISVESYAVYNAKFNLYDLLNQAEEEGAETAAAEEVYNKEDATVEEIQAAAVALQRKIYEVYGADASYDDPVDFTEMAIQTPQPGNDGTTGWVQTNHGGYAKSGKHSDWSNPDDDIEVFGPNFLEYWTLSNATNYATLTNDTLYQVIESLPYGMYRLTADAVVIQQAEEGTEVTGVSLFADGGAIAKKALWSEKNHTPHRYSVNFVVMQDLTTIGMAIDNTNANHAAITNFKLEFLGGSDNPLVTLLQVEIVNAESLDPADAPYSVATEEKLKEIVNEAKALLEGEATDDELKTKTEELSAMIDVVKKEIEKYAWADAYRQNELQELVVSYENDFPELSATLADYASQLDDALYERTLTIEEIDGILAKVDQMIKDGIKAEISVGKEVTGLLVNPNFDVANYYGWTLNSGAVKNPNFGACEAYAQKFDLSQTLTDMPNGRYKVTCQAFYRPKVSADAWADYVDGSSNADVRLFLYGNSISKAVKHVFDEQSEVKLEDGDVQPAGEDGMYTPNNITGIFNYFAAGFYENELEFAVVDGVLTIGLRVLDPIVDAGANWSAFDNFHLYYMGEDASDYIPTIEALIEEAMALENSGTVEEGTMLTEKASENITNAILVGNVAMNGGTVQQCIDAINALNEAIAYAQESQKLTKELFSSYEAYYIRIEQVVNGNDDSFLDLLDEIAAVFEEGDGVFESNEQVQAYLDKLPLGFAKYAISGGIGTATPEKPHDITVLVVNPEFTWDNVDSSYGWTGNPSIQVGVAEFYNTQKFELSQSIVGLISGFYRLSANAFYRAGSTENSTKLYYKDLYPETTTIMGNEEDFPVLFAGERTKALMNIAAYTSEFQMEESDVNVGKWMDPNNEEAVDAFVPNVRSSCNLYFAEGAYMNTLNFEVTEDMDAVAIGIKKGNVKIDTEWCPFDNFKLEYIGAEAPTGIENTMAGGGMAEVVARKFYTVDGMELARPAKGINIVKSVLSDGTVKVTKVLVK